MCVIIYCPREKTISDDKIKVAFKNNPDGAGVMWYDDGGGVHYRKGFDKVDELINFFRSLNVSVPRAIHCRIATSGKVSSKTCHPFPIVKSTDKMGADSGRPKFGCLMHNGIFSRYTPKGGMQAEVSDTMNYTEQVIYPLVSAGAIYNEGVLNLLSEMTSRVLLFLPKFMIGRFGSWEKDKDEGFYASNTTYKYERYYYATTCYDYSNGYYGRNYGYTNYDKDWWKKRDNATKSASRPPECTKTTKTVVPKKKDKPKITIVQPKIVEVKRVPEFVFGIVFSAKNKLEANDLMYEFLDNYYGEICETDDLYDTLKEIGDNYWEFIVETYSDIDKLEKIKDPYGISYFEKIIEDKE